MQFADQRLLDQGVGIAVVAVQALNRGVGDKPLEGLNAGIGGEREPRSAVRFPTMSRPGILVEPSGRTWGHRSTHSAGHRVCSLRV